MPGLEDLSYEIYNRIAEILPTAENIISFAKTCRVIHNAVFDTHASCWRHHFGVLYDLPPTKAVTAIRMKFVERKLFRFRLIFKLGDGRASRGKFTKDEEKGLQLMRELIVESFSASTAQKPASNNVKVLRHLAISTNICTVNNYWDRGLGQPTRLLQAVHLMLLVPQLEQALAKAASSTPGDQLPVSQKAIYAHPDDVAGLFANDKFMTVNLKLLGHLANFFKYYITCYEEETFFDVFNALGKHERPSMWDSQIMQGPTKLGRHWKGAFASLTGRQIDDLRTYRDPSSLLINDQFGLDDGLIDLELDFGPVKMLDGAWPRTWDDALESTPSMRLIEALKQWPTDWIKTQNDPREFTNNLTTEYAKTSYASNYEHMEEYEWRKWVAIHKPAATNPEAWDTLQSRFKNEWEDLTPPATPTAMKFPKKRPAALLLQAAEAGKDYHHFTGKGVDAGDDFKVRGNLHAVAPVEDIPGWQRISFMKWWKDGSGQEWHVCCEGVVLPGNKIILGRWWSLIDDEERRSVGPFILWNVELEA